MMAIESAATPVTCRQCGSTIAALLTSCPQCHWLVHGDRLKDLANDAEAAAKQGDAAAAIATWQQALTLLPPGSRQHEAVAARIVAIGKAQAAGEDTRPWRIAHAKQWTLIGTLGAAALFLVTKGKFLLLGLTKSTTLLSMVAAFSLYWMQWGMLFALGLVLSIYVHEMGHVAALRRYGIPASAPMFIPGIGAFVRMKHAPSNRIEDARVGLAGPLWGLGACLAAAAGYAVTGNALWAAVAHAGAWINLFNLLPVGPLDGGRALGALSRSQRWIIVATVFFAWRLSGEGLLVLILIALIARALFETTAPEEGDTGTLALFVFLAVALTALCVRSPALG
jgi:Zn-dependent protease